MTTPQGQVAAPTPAIDGKPRKRLTRKWVLIISALVVVALAAALCAGEVYARHTAKDCLAGQFEKALGSKVTVGLSKRPMLIQLLTKDVPYVTIDSDDTKFGPAIGMKVHAQASDINIERDAKRAGSVGSSTADVTWDTDGITKTLQGQYGGLVQSVKTNPGDGTLEFALGPGGFAKLVVRPRVENEKVVASTSQATVLGFGFPTTLPDGIVALISSSLQTYPLGMTARSLQITDSGIGVKLAGGHYDLPGGNGNSNTGNNDTGNTNSGNNTDSKPANSCQLP